MAHERLRAAVRHLRQVAGGRTAGDATDRHDLERFVAARDEDAFAAIVRRHGPMVRDVCRRVLRDAAAADDAFQATFLVLVRRARSLRRPELLGPWLHGVAYRTSLKARDLALRRSAHERQAAVPAAAPPADGAGLAEARAMLHEEIARLPEKYRRPVVLCYLQERTNEEAARLLGCPVGTVFSRLAWARQRLRTRLSRRGLALSVAALTALVFERSAPAVPPLLLESTLRAAALLAAGETAAAAAGPRVAAITKEVLRAMFLTRIKPVVALLLVVSVLGPGVVAWTRGAPPGKPGAPAQEPAKPAPAAPAHVGGTEARPERTLQVGSPVHALAFSPDGRLVAAGGFDSTVTLWDARTGEVRRKLLAGNEVRSIAFAPDGKTLACAHGKAVTLWEVASGNQVWTQPDHPSMVTAVAFAPDGATLAAGTARVAGGGLTGEVRLWRAADGRPVRTLRWEGQQVWAVAFSPDGKRVAAGGGKPEQVVRLWDAQTGTVEKTLGGYLTDWLPALPADDRFGSGGTNRGLAEVYGLCFAPDGKTLAVGGNNAALLLLDVPSGHIRLALMGPRDGHKGTVFSVAFSPGGELLLSGGSDQVAKLWDVHSGKLLQTLTGHKGSVGPVAFAPRGPLLATGSEDGTVRLWRLGAGGARAGARTDPAAEEAPKQERTRLQGTADRNLADIELAAMRKKEQAQLQGTWLRMFPASVYNGLVPEREPGWTIKDDQITYDYRVARPAVEKMDRGAGYRINPAASPKTFDLLQADGTTLPGIYLLEGDILVVCLGKAGQERPKGFVRAPDSGQRLLVFQRAGRK